jgi:alginate O-acetyltransferase complex protein AlgI
MFLLGFLPCALAGYTGACRLGPVGAKAWLTAASVLFYSASAWHFLPLLLASVCGNYVLLQTMRMTVHRSHLAALGVALNLAVLGWFKYVAPWVWDGLVLPLGISFFTFTQIGCLLAYAASDEAPPKLQDYALFALFFPALMAGPILNAREMLPQFTRTTEWRLSPQNLALGTGFFLIGLLKKTLLADPLSALVTPGFADPGALSLLPAWQAAAAWSLQLYFDFSGYSDMAVGLALMFGLRFPDNFEQPYRARSVIAYWQSWHISLTRFLMANVHAPLTLAILRRRRARGLPINLAAQQSPTGFLSMIAAPILATMMLAGIWHGAALTFLLFGLLHAGLLLVNHAWRLLRLSAMPRLVGVAATYLSVLIGAVLFRAESVAGAGSMLAGMAGLHGLSLPMSETGFRQPETELHIAVEAMWIVGLHAIVWLAPTSRQLIEGHAGSLLSWRSTPRWALVMGCAATLGLLASGGTGEFVYFHF